MVSGENFKLDIAFSLRNWGKCNNSLSKAIAHCHERSAELRAKIEPDPFFKRDPIVPDADVYDFCATALTLAMDNSVKLSNIVHYSEREVHFIFMFESKELAEKFHEKFVSLLIQHGYISTKCEIVDRFK